MRGLASFIIFSFCIQFSYSQSTSDLNKRFDYDKNLSFPDNFVVLPKQIDISGSRISKFEKTKIQYYIDFLLNEKSAELRQAIFRQNLYFSYQNNPLFAQLGIALSGFKDNYFNIPFLIASKYKLQMNELVDERYEFSKNYQTAQQWMKYLSSNFETPEEVVLAFINTPGGLNRAQIRANSKNLEEYYEFLPSETKDTYFIQLALGEILSKTKLESNKLFYEHYHLSEGVKSVMVQKTFDLKIYESISRKEMVEIKNLNPSLISDFVPKGFKLNYKYTAVPEILDSVYFYQDSILNNPEYSFETVTVDSVKKIVPLKEIYYSVNKGDNLFMISTWYDVEIEDIQIWNKLKNEEIYKGQILKIWVDENLAFDLSKINFLSLEAKEELMEYTSYTEILKNYRYYTVKKGDSLWLIAQRYKGVTPDDIMRWNGISPNIEIDQKILIKVDN